MQNDEGTSETVGTPQIKPVLHSQGMDHHHNLNSNNVTMAQPRPKPIPKGKLQIPLPKGKQMPTAPMEEDSPSTTKAPSATAPIGSQQELTDVPNLKGEEGEIDRESGAREPNSLKDVVESMETRNHPEKVSNDINNATEPKQQPVETTESAGSDEWNENSNEPANERPELLPETESSQHSTQDSLQIATRTSQSSAESKQSLVLLVSSSDPTSVAALNAVDTVLRAKNISYETIDVMDAEAKPMIDDLLSVSRIRNEFPQFFLVDLTTGGAAFWGDCSRFQKDGDLFEQDLFGNRATLDTENSPVICRDPLPETQAVETSSPEATPSASAENLLEQFTMQLKRLEENHQIEMMETERRHAQEIESIRSSINHGECDATRIQLEERLMAQIREKEEKLRDVIQRNEGYQLKLDVLKREVEGTQALLEAKNSDMGKFSEENLKQLRSWEKKVDEAEVEIQKAKEHSKSLEVSLEESKKELSTAHEEHENLRARLKTLAGELKARRAECRELKTSIDVITDEKSNLTLKIENLEFQLSDRDRSGSERYEEIEKLRSELAATTAEVEKLRKIVNEKDSENDRLLSEYKRKTQSALAMANSRTASAVQAKEEAELEARAARSTADSAMERAVQAELKSKAAIAEARVTVNDMEIQRDEAIRKHGESAAFLEEKASEITQLQSDLVESRAVEKGKEDELAKALSDLANEKTSSLSFQKDLTDLNSRISLLRDEVQTLREKLRHAEAAVSTPAEQLPEKKSASQNDTRSTKQVIDSSTVAILQQELRDANQVINELKEALQNAVEVDDKNRMSERVTEGAGSDVRHNINGNNDSIPLFYAMEKQAELNVARNEITRLANLLSNAQAHKMEALDAADDMRRKMEDAEARLMRFEKLRPSGKIGDSARSGTDANRQTLDDSGAVNIEYLKNIMLRYLNATSLSEKRALVPVVGAVLCLTHEEQQKAIASLEESVSIGGVGSTLFESFTGKLTSK